MPAGDHQLPAGCTTTGGAKWAGGQASAGGGRWQQQCWACSGSDRALNKATGRSEGARTQLRLPTRAQNRRTDGAVCSYVLRLLFTASVYLPRQIKTKSVSLRAPPAAHCPALRTADHKTTMATAQATKNVITLKGSTATVSQFFEYALSSILYQRGVYPPESFQPKKQYGITVMAVKDDKLCAYLAAVLRQFSGGTAGGQVGTAGRGQWPPSRPGMTLALCHVDADWLGSGTLQKVVLVVSSVACKEVLERWTFDIQTDKEVVAGAA